jgi:hypothetical protein
MALVEILRDLHGIVGGHEQDEEERHARRTSLRVRPRLAMLAAARKAIIGLRDRGEIGDAVMRRYRANLTMKRCCYIRDMVDQRIPIVLKHILRYSSRY